MKGYVDHTGITMYDLRQAQEHINTLILHTSPGPKYYTSMLILKTLVNNTLEALPKEA